MARKHSPQILKERHDVGESILKKLHQRNHIRRKTYYTDSFEVSIRKMSKLMHIMKIMKIILTFTIHS